MLDLTLLFIYGTIQRKLFKVTTIRLSIKILFILTLSLTLSLFFDILEYYSYIQVNIINHLLEQQFNNFSKGLIINPYLSTLRILLTFLVLVYCISIIWQLRVRYILAQMSTDCFYKHDLVKKFTPEFSSRQTPVKKAFYTFCKTVSYEYYLLIGLILNIFVISFTFTNFAGLYINFELISILIYVFLGFTKTKNTLEATIKYFFFGLFASTLMIWGLSLLYTTSGVLVLKTNFLLLDNVFDINSLTSIGYLFIATSFFLKLGVFPYHFWVIVVYPKLTNNSHLFMLTIINTGFLILLLQTFNYILSDNNNHIFLVTTLLIIAAIGSTVVGGLLLLTQVTFKGVLACNSMINTGFVLLGYGAVFNLNLELNQIQLTHYILYYILIYNSSLFVLFNCWASINIWTLKKQFNIQYFTGKPIYFLYKPLPPNQLPYTTLMSKNKKIKFTT